MILRCAIAVFAASLAAAGSADQKGAMYGPGPYNRDEQKVPPASYIRDIGIDQRLNDQVPLDVMVRDENGTSVPLSKFFDGRRPVILTLVYYRCPSVCTLVLNGVTKVAKVLQLKMGQDYQVVSLSINPDEGPDVTMEKKAAYLDELKMPDAAGAWHFLTAPQASITSVASSVGFRYFYDTDTKTYAHAAAIIVLTPQGRVSRYFFGSEFLPLDLRLGLTEASAGKVGGLAEQIMLLCFQYDPKMGRYSAYILNVVRLGGIITLIGLGYFISLSLRAERRTANPANGGTVGAVPPKVDDGFRGA